VPPILQVLWCLLLLQDSPPQFQPLLLLLLLLVLVMQYSTHPVPYLQLLLLLLLPVLLQLLLAFAHLIKKAAHVVYLEPPVPLYH
jgi:hypothetical protein